MRPKRWRNNMPRLLLSGGGSAQDSLLLDQLLVQLTTRGLMVYLPIALDPHQRPYASCYQWIRSVFTPLGLDRITMWSDISAAKTEEDLKPFAGHLAVTCLTYVVSAT